MYDRLAHHCAIVLMVALSPLGVCAQSASGPDTPDEAATKEIAAATTEPRFLSPWVSYLPESATVPSPRAFLHRIPGAPGELADSATAYAYSRALAAASPAGPAVHHRTLRGGTRHRASRHRR